jgi:alkylation response protein AidB-like acyl-CoA dehydrogenase
MIASVIMREGSAYHKEKYLSQLTSGKSVTASFCLTESNSGSDAGNLKTTAKKTPEGYEISGEKIFVTNGKWSDFFLVMARTGDAGTKGISAFFVDRDTPGLSIGKEEDKEGLTGSSTLSMSFDSVKVPEQNLVGAEGDGFKIAMRALDGGRLSISAQAIGISKAAMDAAVKYSKEREAFGHAISRFQAIQWKIADAATAIAAAEQLMYQAAWLKDQGKPFTKEASMSKVFSTEMAQKVCNDMLQIFGGYGYIKEYPAERFLRDVRVTTLYEGTSEIQRIVISRDLLKNAH